MRITRFISPAIACATALAVAMGGTAPAATSTTVVGATVPSATNILTTGCASGAAGVTEFGSVLAPASNVTSIDCSVVFGSSNDTSMLRLTQSDSLGVGMWQHANGALDTAYAGDGTAQISIGAFDLTLPAHGVAAQSDGKTLLAGYIDTNGASSNDAILVRLDTAGALDLSFNTTGFIQANLGAAADQWNDVAVDAQGRAVVIGHNGGTTFFRRYTTAGLLDTTFGTGGTGTYSRDVIPGNNDEAPSLSIGTDGKISFALYSSGTSDAYIGRLDADGTTLDPAFNGGATVTINQGSADVIYDIATTPTGALLFAGRLGNAPNRDVFVGRFTAAGAPDFTFNGTGYATRDHLGQYDDGRSIAVRPTGEIVVGGTVNNAAGTDEDFAIWQLTALGATDTSFNVTGKRVISFGGLDEEARSMTLQDDGAAVLVGHTNQPGNLAGAIARVTAAGGLDTSFNATGTKIENVSPAVDDVFRGVVSHRDGRLSVAGRDTVGNEDMLLATYDSTRIADYADPATDWDGGANTFGACLRSVAGSATAAWTANATCPTTDGTFWQPIALTGVGASAKVAGATSSGTIAAQANLRFGFRTAATQRPGNYRAPVTFLVVAPNV